MDDLDELVAEPRRFGLEVGDDAGVHQLAAVAFHGPAALGDHVDEATRPFAQLLDPHQASRRGRCRPGP